MKNYLLLAALAVSFGGQLQAQTNKAKPQSKPVAPSVKAEKDAKKESDSTSRISLAIFKDGKRVKFDTVINKKLTDEEREAMVDNFLASKGWADDKPGKKKKRIKMKIREHESGRGEMLDDIMEELRGIGPQMEEMGEELNQELRELKIEVPEAIDEAFESVRPYMRRLYPRHPESEGQYRYEFRFRDGDGEGREPSAPRARKRFYRFEIPDAESPMAPRAPREPMIKLYRSGSKKAVVTDTVIKGSIVKKSKSNGEGAKLTADKVTVKLIGSNRLNITATEAGSDIVTATVADLNGNELARKQLDFELDKHSATLSLGKNMPAKVLVQVQQGKQSVTKVVTKAENRSDRD